MAFQGTVVTIENFLAWKAKFELEMAELRRKRQKEEEQAGKPKLTGTRCYSKTPETVKMMTYVSRLKTVRLSPGKQLFERDHNLDTSDIQFLEDGKNCF